MYTSVLFLNTFHKTSCIVGLLTSEVKVKTHDQSLLKYFLFCVFSDALIALIVFAFDLLRANFSKTNFSALSILLAISCIVFAFSVKYFRHVIVSISLLNCFFKSVNSFVARGQKDSFLLSSISFKYLFITFCADI